jgi:hypothetical protein
MLSENIYAAKCLRTRFPLDAFHAVVNPKTVVFSAFHATMSSDRKVRSLKSLQIQNFTTKIYRTMSFDKQYSDCHSIVINLVLLSLFFAVTFFCLRFGPMGLSHGPNLRQKQLFLPLEFHILFQKVPFKSSVFLYAMVTFSMQVGIPRFIFFPFPLK